MSLRAARGGARAGAARAPRTCIAQRLAIAAARAVMRGVIVRYRDLAASAPLPMRGGASTCTQPAPLSVTYMKRPAAQMHQRSVAELSEMATICSGSPASVRTCTRFCSQTTSSAVLSSFTRCPSMRTPVLPAAAASPISAEGNFCTVSWWCRTAIERGERNWPGASPAAPIVRTNLPVRAEKEERRWLATSATMTSSPTTTQLYGNDSSPGASPNEPNERLYSIVSASYTAIR